MDTSYLSTQVTTIIGQLHGLFDEIGVPSHERQSRESELFTALSETLHNHLRQVTAEKNELTNEANQIIKTIKQMEASLEDRKDQDPYRAHDSDLKVTVPLSQCVERLKEKQSRTAQVHRERFEQIKKLVQALESYSSHLEPSFLNVKLPPPNATSLAPTFDLSPSYIASLDQEFSRVYEEYNKRISTAQGLAEEIVNLWAELGTPQAQTDSHIVKHYRDAPEQLGLHADELKRLQARRDRLLEEKRGRERKLKDLKTTVEGLWNRLGVDEGERKRFLAGNRGCGLRAINEFEAELDRLNELKRQNLHLFVEDARYKLQELWDGLYFSEEEMLEFAPAFSDVYSDALLSAHEAEISRLEALTEQRAPTLELINKHKSLVKDRDDLSAAAQDGSRLLAKNNKGEKRDPTRLLREEKMRKRIAKDLPKIEAELRNVLETWENEYGRPFMVHGESYLDELAAAAAKSLPPRSRTPAGPPPGATTTKKVPLKGDGGSAPSRAGSAMRNRNGPPRPATTTPGGTVKRNGAPGTAISTGGKNKTPSKIPARVPLGQMQHGNNSPERKTHHNANSHATAKSYDTATVRNMGPPARAPPPKMRDLFVPPESTTVSTYGDENYRSASVASNGSGSVRQISPEDVYDDRERMSYVHTSMMPPSSTSIHSQYHRDPLHQSYTQHQQPQQHSYNPSAAYTRSQQSQQQHPHPQTAYASLPNDPSRHFSQTSSVTTAAGTTTSGSENWETFDDTSERDSDPQYQHSQYQHQHQPTYPAAAARQQPLTANSAAYVPAKRYAPSSASSADDGRDGGGYATITTATTNALGLSGATGPAGKKFKALYGGAAGGAEVLGGVEAGERNVSVAQGSESAWTDEDAF